MYNIKADVQTHQYGVPAQVNHTLQLNRADMFSTLAVNLFIADIFVLGSVAR